MTNAAPNPKRHWLTFVSGYGFSYRYILASDTFALFAEGQSPGQLFARAPQSEIMMKLYPREQSGRTAQEAAIAVSKAVDKAWLVAQMHHYGLKYSGKVTVDRLKLLLGSAVKSGKCDAPPEKIKKIEEELRKKYMLENAVHVKEMERKEEQEAALENQIKVEAFQEAESLSQQADICPNLFLQKHFLHDEGGPDKTKMTEPILLDGMGARTSLVEAARKINGLHVLVGDSSIEAASCLVMGWDEAQVEGLLREHEDSLHETTRATDLGATIKAEADAEAASEYQQWIKLHRDFLKNMGKPRSGRVDIAGATGSYIVDIPEISKNWEQHGRNMTMLIMHDTSRELANGDTVLMADFEFGIIEGIMRFSQPGEEYLELESDSSEEDDEEEDEDEEGEGLERKRKWAAPTPPALRSKKARISNNDPLRLDFLWRGTEMGEGEIQLDYDNSNKGYIQFTNNNLVAFIGKIKTEYTGDVEIKGYKVAYGKGELSSHAWSDFSESAHERARVDRW